MKKTIKRIPIISSIIIFIYRLYINQIDPFVNSESYWRSRYDNGGTSGDGSYGKLAKYKSNILNNFISKNYINSVIEFGCGDGNQLRLANYKSYIGFDISSKAILLCRELFSNDSSKKFDIMKNYNNQSAELSLSLDVIFHLVEDSIFHKYMKTLFSSSKKYIIIYSSNTDDNYNNKASHVLHRNFSLWIDKNISGWVLINEISNPFPFKGNTRSGSLSNFYIYAKSC